MKKEITTSVYTFRDLIKNDLLYVDKTEYLYKMVRVTKGQFFCARPRRFGKSMVTSALKEIFSGNRELFEGLYIYDCDYSWEKYPVIEVDFSRANTTSVMVLSEWLTNLIHSYAAQYGVTLENTDPALLFSELIEKISRKENKGVVLLVDDYDKPILDHIENEAEAEKFSSFFDAFSFFQVIKGCDPYLRFVFITGITKFAKVSFFNNLNSVNDITLNEEYACMFGYTKAEFMDYFDDYIDQEVRKRVDAKEEAFLAEQARIEEEKRAAEEERRRKEEEKFRKEEEKKRREALKREKEEARRHKRRHTPGDRIGDIGEDAEDTAQIADSEEYAEAEKYAKTAEGADIEAYVEAAERAGTAEAADIEERTDIEEYVEAAERADTADIAEIATGEESADRADAAESADRADTAEDAESADRTDSEETGDIAETAESEDAAEDADIDGTEGSEETDSAEGAPEEDPAEEKVRGSRKKKKRSRGFFGGLFGFWKKHSEDPDSEEEEEQENPDVSDDTEEEQENPDESEDTEKEQGYSDGSEDTEEDEEYSDGSEDTDEEQGYSEVSEDSEINEDEETGTVHEDEKENGSENASFGEPWDEGATETEPSEETEGESETEETTAGSDNVSIVLRNTEEKKDPEETAENASEADAGEVSEAAVEDPSEESVGDPLEKSVEDPSEESVGEITEETSEENAEKTIEETSENSVDEKAAEEKTAENEVSGEDPSVEEGKEETRSGRRRRKKKKKKKENAVMAAAVKRLTATDPSEILEEEQRAEEAYAQEIAEQEKDSEEETAEAETFEGKVSGQDTAQEAEPSGQDTADEADPSGQGAAEDAETGEQVYEENSETPGTEDPDIPQHAKGYMEDDEDDYDPDLDELLAEAENESVGDRSYVEELMAGTEDEGAYTGYEDEPSEDEEEDEPVPVFDYDAVYEEEKKALVTEIRKWYGGFRFYPGAPAVYNPVSLGKYFTNGCDTRNYWFSTGMPGFIMDMFKKNRLTVEDVTGKEIPETSIDTFNVSELSGGKMSEDRVLQMLFQTGFLTIKRMEMRNGFRTYVLKFPNREVRKTFQQCYVTPIERPAVPVKAAKKEKVKAEKKEAKPLGPIVPVLCVLFSLITALAIFLIVRMNDDWVDAHEQLAYEETYIDELLKESETQEKELQEELESAKKDNEVSQDEIDELNAEKESVEEDIRSYQEENAELEEAVTDLYGPGAVENLKSQYDLPGNTSTGGSSSGSDASNSSGNTGLDDVLNNAEAVLQ
ncbi:MAG: AAA family ATPase [Lachnospiraceae bacterium]|nr:AAA family ATPase [Lachnospiraceae bacterium]